MPVGGAKLRQASRPLFVAFLFSVGPLVAAVLGLTIVGLRQTDLVVESIVFWDVFGPSGIVAGGMTHEGWWVFGIGLSDAQVFSALGVFAVLLGIAWYRFLLHVALRRRSERSGNT
ncbi:MAG: hypothetical protein GY851_27320 [bacterium]|nr:hypothetical protein [bacterium]